MEDLIKRLEEATGSDQDLDAEIHALMPEPKVIEPPKYTTSLDAALTLVPEGWRGTHLWFGPNGSACNLGFDAERVEDRKFVEGRHQQFALAICIAALKARGIQ